MKVPWIPVVIAAVAGGLGCSLVYRLTSGPALFIGGDFLGRLGVTLMSVGGAICGGVGALTQVQEIRSRFSGKTKEDRVEFWFLVVLVVLLLAALVHDVVTGAGLRGSHRGFFMIGAHLLGVAVRWVYDRYGLPRTGRRVKKYY